MACNLHLYTIMRPFIPTFSHKKAWCFSTTPQVSCRFGAILAQLPATFSARLQGSYGHRSVRERLRGAQGPGTPSHRGAGGTARPKETGAAPDFLGLRALFFWEIFPIFTGIYIFIYGFSSDFSEISGILENREDPN